MLGNRQIGITLDLYSHVTVTMQQQAVMALDDLFGDLGAFGGQFGGQRGSGSTKPQLGRVAQSVRAADS